MKRLSIKALRVTAWGRQAAAGAKRTVRAGARDERGVVAIIFALSLVVLAPLILGLFDIYTASEQRAKLQDALDAASLYVARSDAQTSADVSAAGTKVLNANLSLIRGATLISSSFVLNNNVITAQATIQPMALAPGFWAHPAVTASSQVTRSSKNLEVALVLDTTGSMAGSRITSLQSAASDLVDLVVQDNQTPYYSKLAIVPYSNSVNVGTYANAVRGTNVAAVAITKITKANPAVVTAANHGFNNGDKVVITGVVGMTQINNITYTVASKATNTFQLKDSNGNLINTSTNAYSAYSSGGLVSCPTYGCAQFLFTSAASTTDVFQISTCVSDRTTNAFTDAAPSTTYLGRVYPPAGSNNNPCPSATISPLSTDKTALKAQIGTLTAGGSTAGEIGLAWGWYMVSPNFSYLWPTASQPAAYGTTNLLKVVILMTDGAFNTAYASGVISKDSTNASGAGSDSDHININASNGTAFAQAQSLCTNMKAQGIIIYTVGFTVGSDPQAQSILNQCATDSAHVYFPTTGSDLQTAFHAIGQDISQLRLSH